MSPKISIITPVFNGVRFIEYCIRNVIDQNCPDVEHIIVDGGSTDGTVAVIKSRAEANGHIKWISETDSGQSDAMNKGCKMANGPILGFLNVDDYYESGALNYVSDLFDHLPEPSLLVGNCNIWDNDGTLWFVSTPSRISLKNLLLGRFIESFPMNSSGYFYHKSLHEKIGLYEINEHYGMDVHFIIKSVQQAHVRYVDRILGNYRYLEGTKTYEDDKSGRTGPRVKHIIDQYRKRQSFKFRLNLAVVESWGRVLMLVQRTLTILRRR